MLKLWHSEMWAFDAEWVPDAPSGRRAYGLPAAMPDADVFAHMWREAGATAETPRPYLKTVLCRVVSVSALVRRRAPDGSVQLALRSLPDPPTQDATEATLLDRFLNALGKSKPQLVGFNSRSADLTILTQRALVNRVTAPDFCRRPSKPWEGIDYFARGSDYNVDLCDELSSWGKGSPSLHEIATACGIPGKLDIDGSTVVDLWEAGDVERIVQYNECDALTTYLLWLRVALFGGHLTSDDAAAEEARLASLLEAKAEEKGKEHLGTFLDAWNALRASLGAH